MAFTTRQSASEEKSAQEGAAKPSVQLFNDQRASTSVQLKQQQMMGAMHSAPLQRAEDEELLQGKFETAQLMEEEEPLQGKFDTAQLMEEEEPLQGKFEPLQRAVEEEEPLQGKFESSAPVQREQKPNNTGMPDNLKSGIESLSGYSMDDVKVHYNSDRPAQLNAHAYAQGTDIHVAPGQEQHLPHEAWHVVQQKQGRVQPTMQMKAGVPVNDDTGLESEADVMGAKALGVSHQLKNKNSDVSAFQPSTLASQLSTAIQMKTTGVVVEMIAPAAEGMESDQGLISEIESKHNSLDKGLKDRIFYAIGFNRRQGNRTGDITNPGAKTEKTAKRDYQKLGAETFGYIDNYLRWGSDTWIWPNLGSQDLARHKTEGARPMRVNFPFRSWRALAHKTAVGHWGANEWVNKAEDRDLVYKTADSDQDWKAEELAQGLDAVDSEIGVGKSAQVINASVGTAPLVLTTPYHWSKGNAVVTERVDYKYQQFLDQLNQYEVDQRGVHYSDHPLNIYYAEPTTYFTKAAADIEAVNPTGVCEGAAKISAIVGGVIKQKDINAGGTGTIKSYDQVAKGEWATMFKFLSGSKITSDPGDRAKSLGLLYERVKGLEASARPAAIKEGMVGIDQSAFEPGLDAYNKKKNTTRH